MTKTAQYMEFEEGFFKAASEHGCDIAFLRGYVKQADEIVELWKNAFDELAAESKDPQYHVKMANELVYFTLVGNDLVKQAAGEDFQNLLGGMNKQMPIMGQGQDWLSGGGLGQTIGNLFKSNPNLLSSLVTGGGGGGLLGLLLGALTGHPLVGMMLGGLGGAGASAYFGNKGLQDSLGGLFKGNQVPANQQMNQVAGPASPQLEHTINSTAPSGDQGVDAFKNTMHGFQNLTRNTGPASAAPQNIAPQTVNRNMVPQIKPVQPGPTIPGPQAQPIKS